MDWGFVVGWHEVSSVPPEAIQMLGGLGMIFDVTPEIAGKFRGRTIDFNGERFVFDDTGSNL